MGGSTAASYLTARSMAASTVASTSASINSHALAEGFWSSWRQKQLAPGELTPGKVAIVAEVRYDQGGMSTRHDGSKYEMYAERVKGIVHDVLGSSGMCIIVPTNRGGYTGTAHEPFASWQTAHGARLGAFELQLCYHQSGIGIVSELLHSKLISKKWPASRKIELALRAFSRRIILRPLIETSYGMEPVYPIPANLSVRMYTGSGTDKSISLATETVTVGPMPTGPRTLAGTRLPPEVDDPGGEAEAAEARRRITEFMESHDVAFNGAGEDLPSITQAWSVRHTKPVRRRENLETLRGVAAILLQYPRLQCEVHGETGRAQSVPQKLAQHLNIADPVREVSKAMDILAKWRAQACLDALVDEGVPESQLFVTYKGQGGQLSINFVPKATSTGGNEYSSSSSAQRGAASAADAQALAFKLMQGTEEECYVCVDDDPAAQFEPFEKSLNDLLIGARDLGDGALDVPLLLVPMDEGMRKQREEDRRRRSNEEADRNSREVEEVDRMRRDATQADQMRRDSELAAGRQGREAAERKRYDTADAERLTRQTAGTRQLDAAYADSTDRRQGETRHVTQPPVMAPSGEDYQLAGRHDAGALHPASQTSQARAVPPMSRPSYTPQTRAPLPPKPAQEDDYNFDFMDDGDLEF